jgi:hypothetical protein
MSAIVSSELPAAADCSAVAETELAVLPEPEKELPGAQNARVLFKSEWHDGLVCTCAPIRSLVDIPAEVFTSQRIDCVVLMITSVPSGTVLVCVVKSHFPSDVG